MSRANEALRPLAPRMAGDPDMRTMAVADTPGAAARRRVRRACIECRAKKVKCNGQDPCARCASYRMACEYGEYGPRCGEASSQVEELTARIASLEQMFRAFVEGQREPVALSEAAEEERQEEEVEEVAEVEVPDVAMDVVVVDDTDDITVTATTVTSTTVHVHDNHASHDPTTVTHDPTDTERGYADGFGELDVDPHGQLRYVGLGSTASVVDNCVGLRRHIHRRLEREGYETEEPFLASPEAAIEVVAVATPLRDDLPPSALIDRLVNVYTRQLAPLFPIVTAHEIRQVRDRLDAAAPGERDPGDAAILFGVLAAAAPLDDNADSRRTLGPSFYSETMRYVNMPVSSRRGGHSGRESRDGRDHRNGRDRRQGRSQDTVVALGLASVYLAATGAQAEAWMSVGRAIRTAQDAGLHRSPRRLQLPVAERNRRRYVWWCLYVLERQLCTALGRPVSVDDQDCDVEVVGAVDDEERDADGHVVDVAGFAAMVRLHRIVGQILKMVNSVRNAAAWRRPGSATRVQELRGRVRAANAALQSWAAEVGPCPDTEKMGKAGPWWVAQSAYWSAMLLLHRVFMANPHRPSPLASSQAQRYSAAAATDCIRATAAFLQAVPARSHFVVLHGQYVFVSAVVLLHSVRAAVDATTQNARFVYEALRDVERATGTLRRLEEGAWPGARKSRATVEAYREFTFYVLQSSRRGQCQFDCNHGGRCGGGVEGGPGGSGGLGGLPGAGVGMGLGTGMGMGMGMGAPDTPPPSEVASASPRKRSRVEGSEGTATLDFEQALLPAHSHVPPLPDLPADLDSLLGVLPSFHVCDPFFGGLGLEGLGSLDSLESLGPMDFVSPDSADFFF